MSDWRTRAAALSSRYDPRERVQRRSLNARATQLAASLRAVQRRHRWEAAEIRRQHAPRAVQAQAAQLRRFRRRFTCRVCGTPSSGPYPLAFGAAGPVAYDWQRPTGLLACLVCGGWTCPSDACQHARVCRRCAEHPGLGRLRRLLRWVPRR
jgi:hypothetical protein